MLFDPHLTPLLALLGIIRLHRPRHKDDVVLRHDERVRARLPALGWHQSGPDGREVAEAARGVVLVPGEELKGRFVTGKVLIVLYSYQRLKKVPRNRHSLVSDFVSFRVRNISILSAYSVVSLTTTSKAFELFFNKENLRRQENQETLKIRR